jgi:LL-diaminopimelate aminotransferase
MRAAHRLDSLPEYVFAALGKKLKALEAQGRTIIRLDMGSPDGPPPGFIVEALAESAATRTSHGYMGFTGTPQLRQAIGDYYASRFEVFLNVESEILPLIGSKEGIANMALAWLDPGDLALVPDPGYPAYRMGAYLAGADVHFVPLKEERGFLPDLGAIPGEVARQARLLWLNYPNNPTGAVASRELFEEAVHFCRKHEILLCHDVPYADVCFDGYRAPSLLSVPGAKDVAVEFNSLSKSHNMAGWRIGMAVGNSQAIRALLQVKSNVDSGIFLPVQQAAVTALTGDQAWIQGRNREYQSRRDILYDLLVDIWGLRCEKPAAGLYLWPHVPLGYSSREFTDKILLDTGVSTTAGTAFGPHGEGYFRISIGTATDKIIEAVQRLRTFRF